MSEKKKATSLLIVIKIKISRNKFKEGIGCLYKNAIKYY